MCMPRQPLEIGHQEPEWQSLRSADHENRVEKSTPFPTERHKGPVALPLPGDALGIAYDLL